MFETNPTSGASPTAKLNSSRAARFLLISVLAAALLLTAFATPAAAQNSVDICSEMPDSGFTEFIQNAIKLLVFAGVILGTFGVILGFMSEASPFLDSSSYSDLKSDGIIYGWGIPAVLYFLNFMSEMMFGSSWGCFLPFGVS